MRWLLLIIGLAIIVAIVWDGLRRNRRRDVAKTSSAKKRDIQLNADEKIESIVQTQPASSNTVTSKEQQLDLFAISKKEEHPAAIEATTDENKEQSATTEIESTDIDTVEKVEPESIPPVVLYVLSSQNKPFKGQHILQTLLKVGCRFGEMNIFHRYVRLDGKGPICFSVASAVKPGTFNIRNMKQSNTPGLTFFMTLDKKNEKALATFKLMLRTAEQVAEYLGGQLYDDERMLFSKEKLAEYKLRIELLQKQ